jgi:omega-6 fatty acid desaturase (delta-12 desaturase)
VHHLFHEIPFYHADEATVHVKAKLGKLYNYDGTFLPIAAYKVAKECHYVESVEGVQYQKSLSKSVGKKAE